MIFPMKRYTVDAHFVLHDDTEKKIVTRKKKETSNFLLAKYMNVGYYVMTPLFVGVFLGLVLDSYLHTKPGFTISLLILGVISTFYNLYKLTQDKF